LRLLSDWWLESCHLGLFLPRWAEDHTHFSPQKKHPEVTRKKKHKKKHVFPQKPTNYEHGNGKSEIHI